MTFIQTRCPKGHFYDGSLPRCPVCYPPPPPTVATISGGEDTTEAPDDTTYEEDKTGAFNDPRFVVGWLVCTEGSEYDIGTGFRLHADYNRVGRGKGSDVLLHDGAVSRKHFTVTYDVRHDRYYAVNDDGKATVYINEQPLDGRIELKAGDKIEVADTTLIFIPLEQKYVKWQWRKR